MKTIDDLIKETTLSRLQMFGGRRKATADSLGIGVRTLLFWLNKWGFDKFIPRGTHMRFVRCTKNLEVRVVNGNNSTMEIIRKGAVGVDIDGLISFPKEDVRNCTRSTATYSTESLDSHDPTAITGISEPFESATPKPAAKLICLDLSDEEYREYTWRDPQTGTKQTVRIINPKQVYFKANGTTHRVVHNDENGREVASCVPSIGYFGCVCTWAVKPGRPAVAA